MRSSGRFRRGSRPPSGCARRCSWTRPRWSGRGCSEVSTRWWRMVPLPAATGHDGPIRRHPIVTKACSPVGSVPNGPRLQWAGVPTWERTHSHQRGYGMKWSRSRTVKVFAVGATAALLLTACSGTSTPAATPGSAAPAEPVELSIAYWGDFGLTDLVPKYEAENPGVTIKLLEGEYNAQHEALQQELIAGSGAPDIAAIDEGFIVQFKGQADKFTNLLDLGAADYESKYLPWKWQQSLSLGLGCHCHGRYFDS